MDMAATEAARILRGLEFTVEATGTESLRVTTPPHRRDIQAGAADLIEELARIHGYDRLPATLLADELPEQRGNRPLELEERLKDALVDCGLQEVITYSLTEPAKDAPVGLGDGGDYVRLVNPISSERVAMRHSLLGGVLDVAVANLRHTEDVRLFEVGAVYVQKPGEKLPDEPRRLALLMTGRRQPEFWGDGANAERKNLDFFDLKGVIEAVAADLHLPEVMYRKPADPQRVPYLHPGLSAEVVVRGQAVGAFGRLHPRYALERGFGNRVVLAGELDLAAILAAVPERYAYEPVPRFEAVLQDVALIVDEDVPAERVAAEVRSAGGELLRDLRLFDVYRGDTIPAGKKSLAYALTYRADDRVLTDKDVSKVHKKIEDRLRHVLKAVIRGKE
jgi:phenylalanyl-tRNA synthetase beta chain